MPLFPNPSQQVQEIRARGAGAMHDHDEMPGIPMSNGHELG
jgi:hypothetical protein